MKGAINLIEDNYKQIYSWAKILGKIIANITPDITKECADFCFSVTQFNIRKIQNDREKKLIPRYTKILEEIKPVLSGNTQNVNFSLKNNYEQLFAWTEILEGVIENLDTDVMISCKDFGAAIIKASTARIQSDREKVFIGKFDEIINKIDSYKTDSPQIIPRKIHYCWLSGENIPDETIKCIETWKEIMPEYELVLWDKNKFDINSIVFVQEACSVKKWAFAADYIRLYSLYTEGGIYLDSDVIIKKSFDKFLCNHFFTSLEYIKGAVIRDNAFELLDENGMIKDPKDRIFTRGIGIQAAVMGGIKGHPFLKLCLDWYQDKHFILPDGSYYNKIIAPAIYADVMIEYGFRYKDELQKLRDNIVVYPSYVFAGTIWSAEKESYAIHSCKGSWR